MTAVSAHDLTETRDCKVPGCPNEQRRPFIERGPYAGRCDEHYEEMRRKMSEAGRRGMRGATDGPRELRVRDSTDDLLQGTREAKADALQLAAQWRSNGKPETLKEAAQALVQPAAAVDRAAARKSTSDSEYDQAKATLAAVVRVFKQALEAL